MSSERSGPVDADRAASSPSSAALDSRVLVERWEEMSAAYLPGRQALVDAVVGELGRRFGDRCVSIVELGAGPGSLVRAIAKALPRATVAGVDADPVLALIHRAEVARTGTRTGDVVAADLATPGWSRSFGDGVNGDLDGAIDAVVAVQVLHYFAPPRFARLLAEIHRLLAPDGVLVHLDVVPLDAGLGDRRTGDTDASALDPWSHWWAEARRVPALAEAFAARDRLAAGRPPSAEFHPGERELRTLLTGAGFHPVEVIARVEQAALTVAHRS